MNNPILLPANPLFSVVVSGPAAKSPKAITTRPTGLLVVALAAALLAGCNAKDNNGGNNRTAPANQSDQSNPSNGHMDDDNQGTGTRQGENGEGRRGEGMMQQGRGRDDRYVDTMRHGMGDGNRGKTMMNRGMRKGHRMGM